MRTTVKNIFSSAVIVFGCAVLLNCGADCLMAKCPQGSTYGSDQPTIKHTKHPTKNKTEIDHKQVCVDLLSGTITWDSDGDDTADKWHIVFAPGNCPFGNTTALCTIDETKTTPKSHKIDQNSCPQERQINNACYFKYTAQLTRQGHALDSEDPEIVVDAGGGKGRPSRKTKK